MLSVVVALYNEECRFSETFDKLRGFLEARGAPWELILVDDGSSDGTDELLRRLGAGDHRVRVLSLAKNLGQGAALKVGVLASRGSEVLYTDADLAVPLEHAEVLLSRLKAGADMAMAARWVPGSRILRPQPRARRALGRLYYALVRGMIVGGVRDCNCGLKAFRGEPARLLFGMIRCWRWAFNVELLFLARRFGFAVEEAAVEWSHRGGSKVRLSRDILFTLWELALIKVRQAVGVYPRVARDAEAPRTLELV